MDGGDGDGKKVCGGKLGDGSDGSGDDFKGYNGKVEALVTAIGGVAAVE